MLFLNLLRLTTLSFYRLKSNAVGRSLGRITVDHKSSGSSFYTACLIDIERKAYDQLALTILSINRFLKPALLLLMYKQGFTALILAPESLSLFKFILSSLLPLPCLPGNSMLLKFMPVGSKVHNVNYASRAAGTYSQILRHKFKKTMCKLPSGKCSWFSSSVIATFGALQNSERKLIKFTTAGYSFRKGKRPVVRGTAKNPIDHPHGGGQGKTSGGGPSSFTPYGRLTKGYKTVKFHNFTYN